MKYFIPLLLLSFFVSCAQDADHIFKETPAVRTAQNIKELREKLVSSENGWEMTYFPDIDSTKFSDIRKDFRENPLLLVFIKRYLGKGGYKFFVKFNRDGTLQMFSDQALKPESRASQFEVSMGTSTQLSFTTPNYHQILMQNDFLFDEETPAGELLFRTQRHNEQGREYIIMKKLPPLPSMKDLSRKVSKNGADFEKMECYILTITDAKGQIRYETNYAPVPYTNYNDKIINPIDRYIAFMRVPDIDTGISDLTGLGSGYAPSPEGIEFHPGLKFNKETIFSRFTLQSEGVYTSEVNGFKATITHP